MLTLSCNSTVRYLQISDEVIQPFGGMHANAWSIGSELDGRHLVEVLQQSGTRGLVRSEPHLFPCVRCGGHPDLLSESDKALFYQRLCLIHPYLQLVGAYCRHHDTVHFSLGPAFDGTAIRCVRCGVHSFVHSFGVWDAERNPLVYSRVFQLLSERQQQSMACPTSLEA